MDKENAKRCEELEKLREMLNDFYQKHVYNTDPETNPAHKILYEGMKQIEAELKNRGYL